MEATERLKENEVLKGDVKMVKARFGELQDSLYINNGIHLIPLNQVVELIMEHLNLTVDKTRPYALRQILKEKEKVAKRIKEMSDIKAGLLRLIEGCIDEQSIPGKDSFVEMDNAVIHYASGAENIYFKVSLDEVEQNEYFKPYKGD